MSSWLYFPFRSVPTCIDLWSIPRQMIDSPGICHFWTSIWSLIFLLVFLFLLRKCTRLEINPCRIHDLNLNFSLTYWIGQSFQCRRTNVLYRSSDLVSLNCSRQFANFAIPNAQQSYYSKWLWICRINGGAILIFYRRRPHLTIILALNLQNWYKGSLSIEVTEHW